MNARTVKILVVVGLMSATAFSGLPPGVDVPLPGTKMRLSDTSGPAGRRNYVVLRGDQVGVIPDPRGTGATAHIGRVGVGEVTTLDLPASGWSGGASGRQDYKYKSRTGAVISARLAAGGTLRLSARGSGAYPLGGTSQGSVGIIIDIAGTRFCGLFGGSILKDDGKRFRARLAPAPASCPVLGAPTCTPDCTGKLCGDDGCGGSCGQCHQSICDTTIGQCVGCIDDGHAGCFPPAGGTDCCSGVCGADLVCQPAPTTTSSTSTTSSSSTSTSTTIPTPCNATSCIQCGTSCDPVECDLGCQSDKVGCLAACGGDQGCVAACFATETACGNGCRQLEAECDQRCKAALNCTITCCSLGEERCAGVCVDTSTDPNNCGNCGTVCESGQCTGGICEAPPTTTSTTSTTTTLPPEADLSLTKTADPTTFFGSRTITFTVTLHNAGPDTATGVVVKDLMSAAFTFDSSSASIGTYDSDTGIWSVGTLGNGADVTLGITTHAESCQPPYAFTTQTNTAEVMAVNEADPDSAPNDSIGDDAAIASVFFGCD